MQPVWNHRGSRRWSILLTFEKLTQLSCRSFASPMARLSLKDLGDAVQVLRAVRLSGW